MQIIIDTANTRISVKNNTFLIENNTQSKQISPKRISSIAITTNCILNAASIKLAALNEVPIYFFNNFGTLQARLWSPYFKNIATLRRKQLLFYNTPQATNWLISVLVRKAELQAGVLKKLQKVHKKNQVQFRETLNNLIEVLDGAQNYKNQPIEKCRNQLLGIEGAISRIYFQNLQPFLPADFKFEKRSRRPATDYFNAALNYLYGMTYSIVESGVFAKGLDPFIGYLHTDNYQKTSLVFDLIEPIRPLIDNVLIDMCVENTLDSTHFIQKQNGFWISKKGKRVLIPAFNEYLYKRLKVNNKIRRFKDIIYQESNYLGNLINQNL